MKNVILSAKGLCKSFAHNGGQLHILSQVDLELYEGDFTVIMGASGSGKSTLLYALSGMDQATAGQVLYQNQDIVAMNDIDVLMSSLICWLPSSFSISDFALSIISRIIWAFSLL